ncbi:argininosuccinate lyase [Ammonifex thiophilus]|uniref:Argininosuccinate lyase n=1 Tax=Ammonifex thiophilus TaxID=444093 RepID=A0A3D8P4P1_9THEO|nr:argininosuccinate lyase [Ammonifex thiophilus]RDV84203.1 argininosuccinate lyase [Ammonifex thiophilus]
MTLLWGGRFRKETDPRVRAFQDSISFDFRLWPYEIKVSQAHVRGLRKIGVLTPEEEEKLLAGLEEVRRILERGEVQLEGVEDVHTLVERLLVEQVGEVGKKLHTGRSRNDLVVTDLRLYLREEINNLREKLQELRRVLLELAEQHCHTLMPGFTHLQPAQPVTLAHHLLAYYEMFTRDDERLADCYRRTNVLPLGAGALAGSTFPLDREYVAELLGFEKVAENSMDAVSDRDFVVEFCAAAVLLMVHLSRLAEELILWSTPYFDFVELDDAFTTGSSMMPQKKNPDVAELCRAKTARVIGNFTAMATLLKALPLTYNKDLQEDKPLLFDTVDTLKAVLEVFPPMLATMKVKREQMAAAARRGFLTATDLAEYLVRRGLPFREAHRVVGEIVLYCLERGKDLEELTLEEFRRFTPLVEEDVLEAIKLERSLDKRALRGGPAPEAVKARIEELKNSHKSLKNYG